MYSASKKRTFFANCCKAKGCQVWSFISLAKFSMISSISWSLPSDFFIWLLIKNKRLSQQPALGTLTFLRSFVAGKANFCSHHASVVHFTVVKSQAILLIRLGVAEVIYHSSWGRRSYFRRNFISSASFKTTKFLPRQICSGTTILRVDSALGQQRCICII